MVITPTLNLKDIYQQFSAGKTFLEATPITTGHINDSFAIRVTGCSSPGFFLQKINHYIFRDVEGLMRNIQTVTDHIRKKHAESDYRKVLNIIPTQEGSLFYRSPEGSCWRLYEYLDGTRSYDVVSSDDIAREGGKAFGSFFADLSDLDASLISETIPDFHNMTLRLEKFRRAVQEDRSCRVATVKRDIGFIEQRAADMLRIPSLMQSGSLPLRITHNDTKFNNVLFNENNQAVCIVDLDTVMPGSVLFDFGDAIRTGANTAGEDEQNLDLVDINMPIYQAYAEGFIKGSGNKLNEVETLHLAFGAHFMTFIIGLRFLTDYLEGDHYFKTLYPEHNLVRSRVQFRLIESMEKKKEAMEETVMKASGLCVSH